jgi:hypothetical protein
MFIRTPVCSLMMREAQTLEGGSSEHSVLAGALGRGALFIAHAQSRRR